MAKPTADWELIGNKFYRKIQLYNSVFDSDLELENYLVSGAPCSGAVALYRNEGKIYAYRGTPSAKGSLDLYSCSGKLLRQIPGDRESIKAVGWSDNERLVIVLSEGTVKNYLELQGDFTSFTLGNGAEEHGVRSGRFWSDGLVALLGNNTLLAVMDYEEPRPRTLAKLPHGDVLSWAVIPPQYTSSRSVEVLVAIGKSVYVVDAAECEDKGLEAGPFTHIAVSPNGRLIALYTEDAKVWVITPDFQERLSEYESSVKTPPKDLQWCGDNAVVLAWEDEIHIIGPMGAVSKHYYDSFVHLLPEIDGIKVLTADSCDFIQKVPDPTLEVFKLGSTSPASILLDAIGLLEKKSPKADDNVQLIRSSLGEAVDVCVRAAGHEYSVHWQKQLLKAASFGKSVLDLYNSDEFVDITEALRVLNAVRFFEVGLPLSYEQFLRLTPEGLIQRLINRHEFLLALRISEFLCLPVDKIYVHWARQKVRTSRAGDDTICREIVQKVAGKRGVSFEEIARAAYDEGRGKLATELLEHEPRAGRQVPLLLSVGEPSLALDKAIESGDTDLMFYVLLMVKKRTSQSNFFRMINSRPTATAIVEASCHDQDQELLKDLYYQDDRRLDGSNLLLSEAISAPDMSSTVDHLRMAAKLLRDSKEHATNVVALEDEQKLIHFQQAFENDIQERFVGLNVRKTISRLIKHGHLKRAQKIQQEFRVPEKMYWFVKLRALVARRDWRELEEMSKLRKSPIGWEPFVHDILGAGSAKTAALFIPKCSPTSARIEMWVKCGMFHKAGEEALKEKNKDKLEELRTQASGNQQAELDRMIATLQRGR
ncbi:vacuolar protein sorting-associated protein 16 [Piedraia hortae CBS 480.64]|uniref:Probable vacuolar protein sorting-associated protein 16 homolog n=1 Tax=Piedraia hortae CBS 480.64 TaxID=1314780 RepID=A0A6A7C6W7_9PEZI|nr:vacuolar protein sorting-associated protein 16 [Piedraia hortae CBS 480.64]